jgi:excisionase family DNA binding protein
VQTTASHAPCQRHGTTIPRQRCLTWPPPSVILAIAASRCAAHEPAESAAPCPLPGTTQDPKRTARTPAKEAPCEPVKSVTTLGHSQPVASRTAGRPRTKPRGDNPGDSREPQRTQDSPSCAPPGLRLLTRQQAAEYLNLSSDMLDRLTQQGELPRVQLALGNRNVRKVLYDRADLDRLVELSRVV